MTTAENHSAASSPGFNRGKRDFEATFSVRQNPGAIVGSNDQRTRDRRLGDCVDHGSAHGFALRFVRSGRLAETLRGDNKHGDEAEWQTPEKDWLGDPKEPHFGPRLFAWGARTSTQSNYILERLTCAKRQSPRKRHLRL
jgi:hypothetical protein